MAAVSTGSGHTVFSFVNTSIAFTLKGDNYEEHLLEHVCSDSLEEADSVDKSMLICSALSHYGNYFVCCIHKDLYLWNTKDWKLISKRQVNRSVSAITFSPYDDKIAVADKSGDVYLFSVESLEKDGELILGHISMLLDILISPNSKFVITCDRDEKIRVSCFPNAYNIQSYCLGHEEFVTCLCILPHNENILASGSGDGTLRFWNYVLGKQLLCHYCNKSDLSFFKNNNPVISKIGSLKQSENNSLLVVQLISFQGILVYSISTELNEREITCTLKQEISMEAEPWCFGLTNNHLLILRPNIEECLLDYVFCKVKNEFISDNSVTPIKCFLKKHVAILDNVFKKERHIKTLYKRRFDNVQEYLKRKMERMETNTKKLKNLTTSEIT